MERLPESMTRLQKALTLLALDGLAMLVALLAALQLRLGELWPDQYFAQGYGLFALVPVIGMLVSWIMGVPRIVLRSFERRALFRLIQFAFLMSLAVAALNTGLNFGLPRSAPGIWAAVFLVFALFSRLVLLSLIDRLQAQSSSVNVLVYGAGGTGQQLAAALRSQPGLTPVGFLDDNPALRRVEVAGLRVFRPSALPQLKARYDVHKVILAMPSMRPVDRQDMLRELQGAGVEVLTLPSFVELLDGRDLTEQIRPVSTDELLGRAAVDLSSAEVAGAYAGKTVMITGAGGSIGSELVRQILAAKPGRLVLYEQSEFALYEIEREIKALEGPPIVPALGSVTDTRQVERTLRAEGVQIVLHAAAYKHVPMVEQNPIVGTYNNVIGTRLLADAAIAAGVERFILVSTDKAVRPTNAMGATKRLAELVVQDRQTRGRDTVFAMVRFGNVLGSSGSVIPLFREQIQSGGPVTVTHPEVTRYFMTIPEAAQLVLLAGSYAEGGDVFVLDMGQPVKILDLARSLVELSGLTVRSEANPTGEIEIVTTGLRPGEKLYEELLIGADVIATPHPKIMRAAEGHLSETETAAALREIEDAIHDGAAERLRKYLRKWIAAEALDDSRAG
ncbi:MAG: nucleoside-diphosphate sugar epimerase/dehydratase [Pseudomonadota bacterium]